MGCFWVVFFHRVLSKHWRCLGLWLLSGCEVFVTVAKPTPSVMAWLSMSIAVYMHLEDGDFRLRVWMLTELFRRCRLVSPHTGEVLSIAAWLGRLMWTNCLSANVLRWNELLGRKVPCSECQWMCLRLKVCYYTRPSSCPRIERQQYVALHMQFL